MIPQDFAYYRPETIDEAVETFERLRDEHRDPVYYGGGTEILTRARLHDAVPGAVIDLKGIAHCQRLQLGDDRLELGAALTLEAIAEADPWPLLSKAAGRIADHTTRCQITFGGNLAGTIPYREAVLPLLLFPEAVTATVAGPRGMRTVPFASVFDGCLRLNTGEFLVTIEVSAEAFHSRGTTIKRTRIDWIDYPLFTLALATAADGWRLAVTGLTAAPFRNPALERALNGPGSRAERSERVAQGVSPDAVVDDLHGSRAYRQFLFACTLEDALAEMEA